MTSDARRGSADVPTSSWPASTATTAAETRRPSPGALAPEELNLVSPRTPSTGRENRAALRGYDELIHGGAVRRLEAAKVDAGVEAQLHARGRHVAGAGAAAPRRGPRRGPPRRRILPPRQGGPRAPRGRLAWRAARRALPGRRRPRPPLPGPRTAASGPSWSPTTSTGGPPRPWASARACATTWGPGSCSCAPSARSRSSTTSPLLAVDWDKILQDEHAEAEADLSAALEELGGEAEVRVVVGDAGATLVTASEGADLVVVGSRGWGTLKRVALGSTSDRLVHHAACPVVVVPRPAVDAEAGEPAAAQAEAVR